MKGFPIGKPIIKHKVKVPIPCPYCPAGIGTFNYIVQGDRVDESVKEPIRCGDCNKYFRVHPEIKWTGVRMEKEPAKRRIFG